MTIDEIIDMLEVALKREWKHMGITLYPSEIKILLDEIKYWKEYALELRDEHNKEHTSGS